MKGFVVVLTISLAFQGLWATQVNNIEDLLDKIQDVDTDKRQFHAGPHGGPGGPLQVTKENGYLYYGYTGRPLPQDGCGVNSNGNSLSLLARALNIDLEKTKLGKRIVNGKLSEDGRWPWVVSLVGAEDNTQRSCGASLVAGQWLLTAAHCFGDKATSRRWTAILGTNNVRYPVPGTSMHIPVEAIYSHFEFNRAEGSSDIALVKLAYPVNYCANTHINIACLPSEEEAYHLDQCVMAGWGAIYRNGPPSDHLRHVRVKELSHYECVRALYAHHTEHLCGTLCGTSVSHTPYPEEPCSGDNGGPLMCKSTGVSGKFIQSGIMSHGLNDCTCGCGTHSPVVYTKVSDFLPWIENVVTKYGGPGMDCANGVGHGATPGGHGANPGGHGANPGGHGAPAPHGGGSKE